MLITWIHRTRGLLPLLVLIASMGCGSQAATPIANPIANGLRAQAHQLAQESKACREDAAGYRERHPDARQCGSGVLTIGLTSGGPANACATAILAAVPSCRQWDGTYRAMAGADSTNPAVTPPGVELMESKEADPTAGLAADDSAANESLAGD